MKNIFKFFIAISVPLMLIACGKKSGSSNSNCTYNPYGYNYPYNNGYNYNNCNYNNGYGYGYGNSCMSGYAFITQYNSCCPSGIAAPAGSSGCIAIQNGYINNGFINGYPGYMPTGGYYYTLPSTGYMPMPYYGVNAGAGAYFRIGF